MSGNQNEFEVSASNQSVTSMTTNKKLCWRGSNREVIFIDTPGLADTEGRDTMHIAEMVAAIKSEKYVNAFLIVLNGQNNRFD